jgi:hypothetical protein
MRTEDPAAARHGISSGRAFTTRCQTPVTTLPGGPSVFAEAILEVAALRS